MSGQPKISLGRQVGLMRGLTPYRRILTFNELRRISGTQRGPKYFSGTGKIRGIAQKRSFRNPVKGVFMGFFRAGSSVEAAL